MNEAVFYYCFGNNLENVKTFKDYMRSRDKTLDYLVKTNMGYINIEINGNNYNGLNDRNFSYACKVLTNSVITALDYSKTIPTIQINLNHLGKTEEGITEYTLRQTEEKIGFPKVFSTKMKIIVVNVDYFKKMLYNGNKEFIFDNYFLCALDSTPLELEELSKENEEIMEYKKDLERINDDEDFVKWISREEEEIKIRNTYKANGYDEGLETGQKNKQIEITKNMLKENCDIDFISKMTKLTKEEILNLK